MAVAAARPEWGRGNRLVDGHVSGNPHHVAGMPTPYPGPMTSPDRGLLRAARSGALALVVLALAAAGHRVGGGRLPGLPGLATLAALAAVPTAFATRRRLGLPSLVGLLAVGQLVLHTAFAALGADPGMPMGHVHAGGGIGGALPGPGADAGIELPMLAAHVVATVLTAAVLAWGERALWALWQRVRPRSLPGRPAVPTLLRRAPGAHAAPAPARGCPRGLPLGRAPPVPS